MKKLNVRLHQLKVIIKYIIYYAYCKIKNIDNEEIWVISERGNDARDNGYAFYEYLKEKHSELKIKYIIDKNSKDILKIKDKKDIVEYGSKDHYILFITAGKLISTHIMGFSPEFRLFTKLDKYNLVKVKGKKIFLQHGIIKDSAKWVGKENTNLDMFVSGARKEFEFLLQDTGYNANVLKFTGLARYDYLESKREKIILLMPTWRMELFYHSNDFKNTMYYKTFETLINDSELINLLEKNDYKLIFYPHYEMQQYISDFKAKSEKIVIADFDNYDVPDLLKSASLLITDYSSVFFDVAYMKNPIIYYQFDYKDFRKNHYKEGYFNFERDGFGNVTTNNESTIKEIKKYFANGFDMEYEFKEKVDSFFEYRDRNNCERIYNEIINLK